MNTSKHTNMTIQSTTAMNTTTAMPPRNPAAEAYWRSVKLCIARADGSTEIHHMDGRVGRFSGDGRKARASEGSMDSTSVTLAA
jgi:hypothetical protein